MIFHLGFELPTRISTELNSESSELTAEEIRILKRQIRQNASLIDHYVARLDLLVNKERYPRNAIFIHKIRRRLELLMEENDTFRKVLWNHYQSEEIMRKGIFVFNEQQ